MSFPSARSWAADIRYRLQKHTSHTAGRHLLELDCSGLSQENRSNVLDVGERRLFYLSLVLPIIHLRLLGNTARPGPNPINPPILFWTEPSPWNVNTRLNSILCCNQSSIYYDNECDWKPFSKNRFWKVYFEWQHRTTTFVLRLKKTHGVLFWVKYSQVCELNHWCTMWEEAEGKGKGSTQARSITLSTFTWVNNRAST